MVLDRMEQHVSRILASYRKWTGEDLIELSDTDDRSVVDRLNLTNRVLLSHGTEADPILNYGNNAALALWEMEWENFIQMPSRLTAEPMERGDREKLLFEVKEKGYSNRYTGVRVSSTGRRFQIENAAIWNVINEEGRMIGQAASFPSWTELT